MLAKPLSASEILVVRRNLLDLHVSVLHLKTFQPLELAVPQHSFFVLLAVRLLSLSLSLSLSVSLRLYSLSLLSLSLSPLSLSLSLSLSFTLFLSLSGRGSLSFSLSRVNTFSPSEPT